MIRAIIRSAGDAARSLARAMARRLAEIKIDDITRKLSSIAAQRANDDEAERLLVADLERAKRKIQCLVNEGINETSRANVRALERK